MLNLRKVLGAKPKEHVQAQLAELLTPWGEQLDAKNVLQEHPNPQMRRDNFVILNGMWDCAFVESDHEPAAAGLIEVVSQAAPPQDELFNQRIMVPFSPESALSGVRHQLQPNELLWYRRAVRLNELDGSLRCLLHFEAVDYACACRVNGKLAGVHAGAYDPFVFDISDLLCEGHNEVTLCVADPSEYGGQLRGKQRFDRGDIWYTAQSGIWQSVWVEWVPAAHIEQLQIEPNPETGILVVGARVCGPDSFTHYSIKLEVLDNEGGCVACAEELVESSTCAVAVHVPDVRLWSPDDPYLYQLRITLGDDVVHSYCGFRSVQMRSDEAGHPRVFLNGKPLFIRGVLDQAYWSDGLMTAPSDEALVFDIKAMHDAGFNLMRKHIKVESARWYYHCDRLGMLVIQDMVQGGDAEIRTWDWSYKPTLFKFTWNRFRDDIPAHWPRLGAGGAAYRSEWREACCTVVRGLGNHPCIIGWSLFNEGWGQFNARAAYEMVRRLDPTRVIDAVSGWYDQRCGDFVSVHNYFRDLEVWPSDDGRAFFVSEFGGYSHRVSDHSSLDECYGYEIYDDINELRAKVASLLAHMNSLESQGLAGYVYTQVSDIEEETNGLLTYDRRVNKLA